MRPHPTYQRGSIWVLAVAVLLLGAGGGAAAIEVAEVKRAEPVDFAKEILPILRQNCIACHNARDREADLVLETPADMRKGGESGPAIVEGKGADSLLLKVSAKLEKPFMPPKTNKVGANPLTPQELGLIKLWIDQGAKGDGAPAAGGPIQWHPLPEGLNPIYAVAVTNDAQLAACNRANQIFVYSLPRRTLLTRLTDPALLDTVAHGRPGVAHRDLVQSLAFSPDGKLLASGGYREVKIWQRPDPAVRFTLPGLARKRVGSLATSPDGKTLAVGSDDGVIHLINVPDGKPRVQLNGHTSEVTVLRFSDEGSQIFSGSADKSMRVWNAADGSLVARVDTPQPVASLLVMKSQLVSAGGDNAIRLWAMPEPARMIGDVPGPITAAAAGPDRKRVAVAGAENAVRMIDVESGKSGTAFAAHPAAVRAIAFDGGAKQVLAASVDGTVVISGEDGKPLTTLSAPGATLTAAALRPDAKQAATATGDGRVSLWRLDAPAPRVLGAADEAAATAFAVSANNQFLATAGSVDNKPAVIVRNIATGDITQKLLGAEGPVAAVAFGSDNARVIAACADKTARVWTLADGKEVAKFAGHATPVTAVTFHPDNVRAITTSADGVVKVWTIADAKEVQSIAAAKGAIVGLAILPKDQIVTASADQTLSVFELNTGAPVRSALLPAAATSLAASRDGARLAVATADKQVRLINAADGAVQQTLTTPAAITSLSFSADGKRLVAAGEKRATVFNVDDATAFEAVPGAVLAAFAAKADELVVTGDDKTVRVVPLRFEQALSGITKAVNRLLYSNDGSLLIAGSDDGTVRAYTSSDGVAKYAATHGAPVRDVALSPDGSTLASGGDDRLVKLWNASSGAAAAPKPQVGPLGAAIASVAFSADGKRVIAATTNAAELTVFDREQGVPLESYASHSQPVTALVVLDAPKDGGDVVVIASADKSLRIFRTSLRGQLAGHTGVVTSLAAVPGDPARFLSGSADGTVRQWNLASANPERQFAHGAPVTNVAVRPDAKVIASAGGNFAKLFDFASGNETATLKGDRTATENAQLAERLLAFKHAELNYVQRLSEGAVARHAAETQAVAKAAEGKTASDKALAEKQTALTAKLAAKEAADKVLADAAAAVVATTAAQASADQQLAAAKAAADSAGAKVIELAASSQKIGVDAQALAQAAGPLKAKSDADAVDAAAKGNAAADAKAASETAATASANAAKAADDAKAAAEKAPNDAALQEAAKVAAKVAADAAAAAKTAAEAHATAQKTSDDGAGVAAASLAAFTTAQRAADDGAASAKLAALLHESAQKLAAERTAAVQKATEAKAAVDAALAAAKAKQPEADAKAKAAANEASQADKDLGIAQINLASADQTVAAARISFADAEKYLADRKAAHALATADVEKVKVDLDNAKRSATESERPVNAIAFSADGTTVYTAGGDDGAVRAYSSDTGIACEILRGHNAAISALAVAPDGTVFSGSLDRTVKCSDANPPWTLKATIGTGDEKSPLADRVLSLAFSPDAALLATGGGVPSRSGELKCWSASTGQLFREFPDAHSDTVYGLSFSGDGKFLASGAADKFAKVWNVQSGSLVRSFEGHTHHVLDVSLRYDGRVLTSVGADNAVKLWDVASGEQRATNAQFSKFEVTSVSHVGFTDRFLVTTGEGNVRLVREDLGVDRAFDVAGGASNFVYAGAATPDGSLILSGGYDSVLRLRDARDGKVVADLAPPK